MSNIIVVFPKRENAVNIRNSLVRAGICGMFDRS